MLLLELRDNVRYLSKIPQPHGADPHSEVLSRPLLNLLTRGFLIVGQTTRSQQQRIMISARPLFKGILKQLIHVPV
jgi:hypothetical protein